MKQALKALLLKLEAIQEEHDGLGETNVRDHMGDHVLNAFLRPRPGYVPSGEYGLDPKANRQVAAAISDFCKAAEKEARRMGLVTYEQRVTAFQDAEIVTPSGSDYNNFFGVIELEQEASPIHETAKTPTGKPVKRAYVFDRPGSLDDLHHAFDLQRGWSWQTESGGAMDNPCIEAWPEAGVRLRVREGLEEMDANESNQPPEFGFIALLEAPPERIGQIEAAFRKAIGQAAAINIAEKDPYWW